MVKVTVIGEGAKINHQLFPIGTVMDLPDELVGTWRDAGLIVVGEVVPNIPQPEPPKIPPPKPPKTEDAKKVVKE
jgi:hypothetical protein